jgi:hypothetical protein
MVPVTLAARHSHDKRTAARFTQSTGEENPPGPKKMFLMESGRKSSGRTVSFKPLEEDGFQIGAGRIRTFEANQNEGGDGNGKPLRGFADVK